MKRITVLEPNIANQIAAGEVVERPASVVKELVENSIDAGSTAVTVEIRNGGIDYIRITDNGSGIPSEDVPTAFLRHATSKLSTADELTHIETLGFRGEALASIAAVAKVSMRTRTHDGEIGTHYSIDGGQEVYNEPCGCPEGTTIEVSDLFFNVPARLKFLKSPRSEAALTADYVMRLILANTGVAIKLINNGKVIYHSRGDGSLENAMYCVYGSGLNGNVYELGYDDGYLRIDGYVGSEALAQSTRSRQSVFVNGRYIKSPAISYAVQRAFDTRLMHGRFPFFVLDVLISTREIDVNVHPNKLSVRFKDEERVGFAVTRAVKDAFVIKPESAPHYEPNFKADEDIRPPYYASDAHDERGHASQNDIYALFGRRASDSADAEASELPAEGFAGGASVATGGIIGSVVSDSLRSPTGKWKYFGDSVYGTAALAPKPLEDESETEQDGDDHAANDKNTALENAFPTLNADIPIIRVKEAVNADMPSGHFEKPEQIELGIKPYTVIGVAFDTYIFVQQGESVFCIDQHAAHERMLYEKLIANELRFDSQILLTPELVRLDPTFFALYQDNSERFAELGFDIEPFGDTTVCVRAVPSVFSENLPRFINDALSIIAKNGRVRETDLLRAELIQAACKGAVKAGDRLESEEIESILSAYEGGSMPLTCPHGRPVMIVISKQELKKRFKRIV